MLNLFPGMLVNAQDAFTGKFKILCIKQVSIYSAENCIYKLEGVNEVVYVDASSNIEVLA